MDDTSGETQRQFIYNWVISLTQFNFQTFDRQVISWWQQGLEESQSWDWNHAADAKLERQVQHELNGTAQGATLDHAVNQAAQDRWGKGKVSPNVSQKLTHSQSNTLCLLLNHQLFSVLQFFRNLCGCTVLSAKTVWTLNVKMYCYYSQRLHSDLLHSWRMFLFCLCSSCCL